MATLHDIERLPAYLTVEGERYFLSLNKCLDGSWSAGYITYDDQVAIGAPFPPMNNITNLDEAYIRLKAKYDRFTKQSQDRR